MPNKLLVIVGHKPSVLLEKGEYIPRYYNPGNVFDEIHLLMTDQDRPNKKQLAPTVGDAKLHLHNLPKPDFLRTLGWQIPFVQGWIRDGLALAEQIQPTLIRTHNNYLEGYLATRIKKAMGVPFVTSVHGVWDQEHLDTLKEWIIKFARYKFERITMRNADAVFVVYQPIDVYAKKYGSENVHHIYNMVSSRIQSKKSYKRSGPMKLITINRQEKNKNPENIIRAMQNLDCHYLIIGDGAYHDMLVRLVKDLDIEDKVEFIRAMPNSEIVDILPSFDMMVTHCDWLGVSKTMLEAALARLPIVVNRHPRKTNPEHNGDWLRIVENTPKGYREAISELAQDETALAEYGDRAYTYAKKTFDPEKMEKKIASLYTEVMRQNAALS